MVIVKPLIVLLILIIFGGFVLNLKINMVKAFSQQNFNPNAPLGINYTFNTDQILPIILVIIPALSRTLTFM